MSVRWLLPTVEHGSQAAAAEPWQCWRAGAWWSGAGPGAAAVDLQPGCRHAATHMPHLKCLQLHSHRLLGAEFGRWQHLLMRSGRVAVEAERHIPELHAACRACRAAGSQCSTGPPTGCPRFVGLSYMLLRVAAAPAAALAAAAVAPLPPAPRWLAGMAQSRPMQQRVVAVWGRLQQCREPRRPSTAREPSVSRHWWRLQGLAAFPSNVHCLQAAIRSMQAPDGCGRAVHGGRMCLRPVGSRLARHHALLHTPDVPSDPPAAPQPPAAPPAACTQPMAC